MPSELHVPNHMILKDSAGYEVMLEAKIKDLELGMQIHWLKEVHNGISVGFHVSNVWLFTPVPIV